MSYKTPGVYVKEISIFPPSVAEVETAIPAFVGYTEKAERNGEDLTNIPTKITSLLEYRELFGGAFEISQVDVTVNSDNNYAVTGITIQNNYRMFDALRMFFDNGGGKCYIVSVGPYEDNIALAHVEAGDEANPVASPGLRVGVKALEQFDEPTMILFPDAVELANDAEFYGLQQMALAQCNKLQDRVGVLDLKENIAGGWQTSVGGFRNGIGINNLKYGAAYTPFLYSSYSKEVPFSVIQGSITDTVSGLLSATDLLNLTSDSGLNALVQNTMNATADATTYESSIDTNITTNPRTTIRAEYEFLRATVLGNPGAEAANLGTLLNNIFVEMIAQATRWRAGGADEFVGANLLLDLEAYATDSLNKAATSLIELEKNADVIAFMTRVANDIYGNGAGGLDLQTLGWLSNANADLSDIAGSTTTYTGANDMETATNIIGDLNTIFSDLMGFYDSIAAAIETHIELTEASLYGTHPIFANISRRVGKEMSIVPPSGAIAGVYSYVDDNRGVFKAPANVSLSSVSGPVQMIDDDTQEDLNVDVNAGKSINAIRAFSGKGTLVWGARTLAGNDNEWRYISVRRFFNMVEESLKKSTGWAVFEPNDASTWSKVRSMISSYLLQKWKEGALQGATPEDAFFVKIGLGLTMTYDDILNGIMNVEIGMAVVRPAEFIILKFSHKVVENA